VSAHDKGAYTGEVSAAMLREFGVRYAIVGHSERRQYHGETDALVADKAKAALAQGITPIVCVGETLAQREAGQTEGGGQAPAGRGDPHQRPLHQRDGGGL
jgi:triosephosphate isomerase